MEAERQIMVGQGAVMLLVLFVLTWQGGVHWLLAALIALLLMPLVLIAVEGVRYYVESRERRRAQEGDEAEARQREAAE
jgi:uncharacterized protein (DUF58 family)